MSRCSINLVVCVLLLLSTGCHSISWTEWQYSGINRQEIQSTVRIESNPPGADVFYGESRVGTTPMTLTVPYSETAALFTREQVETKGFSKYTLQTQTERRDRTNNASAVTVRVTRPRYRDGFAAFTVPPTGGVNIPLEMLPTYERIKEIQDDLPRKQAVLIRSTPVDGVAVYLGEKLLGVTPFTHEFPYAETEIVLEKEVVQETGGSAPQVDVATRRLFGGRTEGVFNLIVRREGYVDALHAARIPLTFAQGKSPEIVLELAAAPLIHDVECSVRFTAREKQFAAIRAAVERFATPRADGSTSLAAYPPDGPERAGALDVFTQTFFLRVKDTQQFNALIADLCKDANVDGYELEIANARMGAEFNTNAALAEIEHVLRGRVRPRSALYLVSSGKAPSPADVHQVDGNGAYSFPVRLRPDVSSCYLVSIYDAPEPRYSAPMCVFLRVDVHTQQLEEIPQSTLELATGVSFTPALIQELAPRWAHKRLEAFEALRTELLAELRKSKGASGAVGQNWLSNIDRNMDNLRRVAAEGEVDSGTLPIEDVRDWLNKRLAAAE